MKAVPIIFALYFGHPSTAWAPTCTLSATTRSLGPKFHQAGWSYRSSPTALKILPSQSSILANCQSPQSLKDNAMTSIKRVASAVKREFEMTCGMLQSDCLVTIVLGSACTIAFGIARTSPLSVSAWVSLLAKTFLWFFGYGYFFDIGNQMTGIEEDKLNNGDVSVKANRPFATRAMSLEEGKIRYVLSGIYYLGISFLFGGAKLSLCALLWIVSSQLYNFHGWGDHFATKNYCIMSTGSIALLLGARTIAKETQYSTIPSILSAIWIGLCMDSQDFRDEAGDRLSGRRTTSVLWGVGTARKAWVVMTTVATGLLTYIMRNCVSWQDAVIAGGIIALMVRTLQNKTAKEDYNTYNGICLAGAAFFVRSAFWAHSF